MLIQSETPVVAQAHTAGTSSIEALQTQIVQGSQQLASLRAQHDVLEERINSGPSNETSAALTTQEHALSGQITQLEMSVQGAKAELASRLGVPERMIGPAGTVVVPSQNYRREPDPDMVVGMTFVMIIAIAFPLAVAYARRIWKGTKPKEVAKADESPNRFDRIEQAMDAIAIEVERISEGQRFVTKVLADRPMAAQPAVAAVGQASVREQRGQANGVSEGKPILALGAGPMEPIRMPERQAVRESITPH